MSTDYIVFGQPQITEQEVDEVCDSLRKCWIGTGPKVARFQEDFARYKQASHAVAVSSCTAALHLSLLAVGIRPEDEVITTPMTFCATANAIIHAGATPVFADCDPVTQNISPEEIERRITPRTRAIVIVHMAGLACDMDRIVAISKRYNLLLIEDCAHAVEGRYRDQPLGTFGDVGCFSFYATKNVTTAEGGMVITASERTASWIKMLALHGMSADAWARFSDQGYKHYEVLYPGFKYNMTDLQAAIGIHQLERVKENWLRRQQVWQRYMDELADLPLTLPVEAPEHIKHSYHLFTIRLNQDAPVSRDDCMQQLHEMGIGTGVHYRSLHEHHYYQRRFNLAETDFPNALAIGRSTLSIPLSAALTDEQVTRVILSVRKVMGK